MDIRPFIVTWKIEIDATSPQAAAEITEGRMGEERDANVFEVSEVEDGLEGDDMTVVVVRKGVADG